MIWKYRNIPTVDIYFRAPLADVISEWPASPTLRPIRRIGPHTFVCRDQAVILRYLTHRERRTLTNFKPRKIYYLLDDDLSALAEDESLPGDYRKRLAQFATDQLPWIVERADEIVAPSPEILTRFPWCAQALLHPSYTAICPSFAHFSQGQSIDILYPGTRSHLADLVPLAKGLRALVERDQGLSVTTFLGEHAPEALKGHPRLVNRPAEKWPRYRKTLSAARFHLALAPNADTPFNRGRSTNKILDVAAVGAAGLYSNRPPSARVVTHNVNGVLLGDDPLAWTDAVVRLAENRTEAQRLAEDGARLARRLGDPRRVRAFWLARLCPEHPDAVPT